MERKEIILVLLAIIALVFFASKYFLSVIPIEGRVAMYMIDGTPTCGGWTCTYAKCITTGNVAEILDYRIETGRRSRIYSWMCYEDKWGYYPYIKRDPCQYKGYVNYGCDYSFKAYYKGNLIDSMEYPEGHTISRIYYCGKVCAYPPSANIKEFNEQNLPKCADVADEISECPYYIEVEYDSSRTTYAGDCTSLWTTVYLYVNTDSIDVSIEDVEQEYELNDMATGKITVRVPSEIKGLPIYTRIHLIQEIPTVFGAVKNETIIYEGRLADRSFSFSIPTSQEISSINITAYAEFFVGGEATKNLNILSGKVGRECKYGSRVAIIDSDKIPVGSKTVSVSTRVIKVSEECNVDSDCPPDFYGARYCMNNTVMQSIRDWSCVDYKCVYEDKDIVVEECKYGCKDGKCIEKEPFPWALYIILAVMFGVLIFLIYRIVRK